MFYIPFESFDGFNSYDGNDYRLKSHLPIEFEEKYYGCCPNSPKTLEKEDNFELAFQKPIGNQEDILNSEDNYFLKDNKIIVCETPQKITKEETKETNFLSKKTRRSSSDDQNENEKPVPKKGRKTKQETEKGEHTKYKEDNMMRKVKSNFFCKVHKLVNGAIKNKNYQFLKLHPRLNKELKKEFNEQLMEKSFKYLYENEEIGDKYSKSKDKENSMNNKKVIEYLYSENNANEEEVRKILDKIYIELFNELKVEFSKELLKKIEVEERNKGENEENIKIYIEGIKNIIENYEKWFNDKKGREGRNHNY